MAFSSMEENEMELIIADDSSSESESFETAIAASTKNLISLFVDIASMFIGHLRVLNEQLPQHLVSYNNNIYHIF